MLNLYHNNFETKEQVQTSESENKKLRFKFVIKRFLLQKYKETIFIEINSIFLMRENKEPLIKNMTSALFYYYYI